MLSWKAKFKHHQISFHVKQSYIIWYLIVPKKVLKLDRVVFKSLMEMLSMPNHKKQRKEGQICSVELFNKLVR